MAVEFNEPVYGANQTVKEARKPSVFIRTVLKTGLAKDVIQAKKVLLVASVLVLLFAAFLIFSGTAQAPDALPDPIL
ncbi:hypothetical protein KKD81_00335 [Patescibacteria group bacterium]|nr:hypothetical protein [Patescibacteria group bacterium]